MARLSDFRSYLNTRAAVLEGAEKCLLVLQEKYEEFYGEVSRVREAELQQLRSHILQSPDGVPASLKQELDVAVSVATEQIDAQLEALQAESEKLDRRAEGLRKRSVKDEEETRRKNVKLDDKEENLKARSETLVDDIARYNRDIRELGRGFGFFKNFFRMRGLQRERKRLDEEQADVAARIDKVRQTWVGAESGYENREQGHQNEWVALRTDAAAIEAKLEHLRQMRPQLIERTALEMVLHERAPKLVPPKPKDPPCPRCQSRNPQSNHFCHICAHRLTVDRPDLGGSLLEIAELNRHHKDFSAGMKACQEIIGLVRGLITGISNFTESVDDMITTERKHPVAELQIEVPKRSVEYSHAFEELAKAADVNQSLHPIEFARSMHQQIEEVFTEPKIKSYFETMGKELSKQAERQW